ncbi:MAG: amino acid ABC transporter permease [Syntrophomonadaceae bacterium]|nr:amino acid ABC transporter permease [Syntrophomonadaceae bacterium]
MQLIVGNNYLDSLLAINGLQVVIKNIPYFLEGALLTLQITTLSVIFGMFLGLIAGLFKLSKNRIMFGIASAYIDFFRGTPLYVQILLLYFGILPLFMDAGPFVAAVIACSLNCGAYTAEIVRAGIQAVDKGQMEAARSLGMTNRQAMTYVILPQAYKIVIPPLLNEFIAVLKDTSLVAVISAEELTLRGTLVYSTYFEAAWIWGTVALIYFIMTKTLALLGDYLERRMATE